MQLQIIIKNQEAELKQKEKTNHGTNPPTAETIQQLSAVIEQKDQELEVGLLYSLIILLLVTTTDLFY